MACVMREGRASSDASVGASDTDDLREDEVEEGSLLGAEGKEGARFGVGCDEWGTVEGAGGVGVPEF